MKTLALRRVVALAFALLAPVATLTAQWSSTTYVAANGYAQTDHMVVHQNASGIQVYSALTQKWRTVSPPGATIRAQHDWVLVTEEAGGVLRGYSALLDRSTAITTAPGGFPFVFTKGKTALVVDNPPSGVATMRAYSALLNAWSSVTPAVSYQLAYTGEEFAVFQTNNEAWGYSAYHGSWSALAHAPGSVLQLKTGAHLATIELDTPPPAFKREIAAYSPWTANWAIAPAELWAGGWQVWGGSVFACNTRVSPSDYRWMGYSAYTGQWVTSPLAHANLSNVSVKWADNVIVASDADPSARFEAFGARNTTWRSLTGANLDFAPTFAGVNHDYGLVANSATGEVHAISGLRASPWTSVNAGASATFDTSSAHIGIAQSATPSPTYWAFTPIKSTWSAPLVVNPGSTLTLADGVARVLAANVDASNHRFHALAARTGTWVAGPLVPTSETYAMASGSTLVLDYGSTGPAKGKCRVFDERYGAWAPLYTALLSFVNANASGNAALVWFFGQSPIAYSTRRGDWLAPAGAANVAQTPTLGGDVIAYVDAASKLWAYSAIDAGRAWLDWPNSLDYAVPGAIGSVTPKIGYSVRGTPGVDFALVYAAPSATPGLALPGFGGLLHLDAGSAFSLGSLGLIDADGVREQQYPLAVGFGSPTQFWLQPVLIDTGTLQLRFGGRAEQAWML
jgi:hypothetical protein